MNISRIFNKKRTLWKQNTTPVTKQVETHIRNTEFNEKFGLSTIEDIIPQLAGCAYNYVLKHLDKGEKLIITKNYPNYITRYIKKKGLLR